jgi:hypothetical protein
MAKNTNHLQCGCKVLMKRTKGISSRTSGQAGFKCRCTTITDKGYRKSKGKIITLKFASMFVGKDSAIV